MNLEYLSYSIIYFFISVVYFKYSTSEYKKKNKENSLTNYQKGTDLVFSWSVIIMFGIISIIFFLKSIIE